jgi:hypothetical protein
MNTVPPHERLTIGEVAHLWGRNTTTVRRALNSCYKPLRYRRSGNIILIEAGSALARFGPPVKPFNPHAD